MKIDGKKIAQEMKKKKDSDMDLKKDLPAEKDGATGSHLIYMSSFMDAIHAKDPEMAHKHMMDYARSIPESKELSDKDDPQEIEPTK